MVEEEQRKREGGLTSGTDDLGSDVLHDFLSSRSERDIGNSGLGDDEGQEEGEKEERGELVRSILEFEKQLLHRVSLRQGEEKRDSRVGLRADGQMEGRYKKLRSVLSLGKTDELREEGRGGEVREKRAS